MNKRERLSPHFCRYEFACRCGCGFDDVDRRLVEALEALRALVGKPIHVNSGCRCPAHNREVGGMARSQHLLGKAADITVAGKTPEMMASRAEEVPAFHGGGIGLYDAFTHVDVRRGMTRWDYRKNKGTSA